MTLGQKLISLRKARGMTQEELSEAIGVTRQTISKWELDTSTPDLDYLCKLCDLFGVTADYLIRPNIETKEFHPTSPPPNATCIESPTLPIEEPIFQPGKPKKAPLNTRPAGFVLLDIAIFFFIFGMISLFSSNQMPEMFLFGCVALVFSLELLFVRWHPLFIVMWTAWLLVTCSPIVLVGSILILFESPFNWRFIFFILWVFYTAFCIGVTIGMIRNYMKSRKTKRF